MGVTVPPHVHAHVELHAYTRYLSTKVESRAARSVFPTSSIHQFDSGALNSIRELHSSSMVSMPEGSQASTVGKVVD